MEVAPARLQQPTAFPQPPRGVVGDEDGDGVLTRKDIRAPGTMTETAASVARYIYERGERIVLLGEIHGTLSEDFVQNLALGYAAISGEKPVLLIEGWGTPGIHALVDRLRDGELSRDEFRTLATQEFKDAYDASFEIAGTGDPSHRMSIERMAGRIDHDILYWYDEGIIAYPVDTFALTQTSGSNRQREMAENIRDIINRNSEAMIIGQFGALHMGDTMGLRPTEEALQDRLRMGINTGPLVAEQTLPELLTDFGVESFNIRSVPITITSENHTAEIFATGIDWTLPHLVFEDGQWVDVYGIRFDAYDLFVAFVDDKHAPAIEEYREHFGGQTAQDPDLDPDKPIWGVTAYMRQRERAAAGISGSAASFAPTTDPDLAGLGSQEAIDAAVAGASAAAEGLSFLDSGEFDVVVDAQDAHASMRFSDVARRVDEVMSFVGPMLPETARGLIRTATAAAPVLDGNATSDQKATLLLSVLGNLPLGDTVETVVDYGQLGLQAKQFFTNPSAGGAAALAANLIGRGVGPRTTATIQTVANAIQLGFAPTPQNFANFTWSAVNLSKMYEQVRIDMGEAPVAGGAVAEVTFMGTTNSVGPRYRYTLAGDQPGLPALNRAIFDLIPQSGGSFAFSGKGFRDPLSFDSDVFGEMVTPGVITGLGDTLWLKRGPDNMHDGFRIDGDLARLLMEQNGGNSRFDVGRGWSAFGHVDNLFSGFALDTVYNLPAKEGFLSEIDVGNPLALRDYPHGIPGVQGWDDKVVAAFDNGHRFTFRDTQSAAIFQMNGADIVSQIASDPALIAIFGPARDIQGMLDHVIAHPAHPNPEDPFSVFSYLAANPDLRAHFDERDALGVALHYATAGHLEGRPRHASEEAARQELLRYIGFSAFDEDIYRALYPDVAAAIDAGGFASAREHFRVHGFEEGRLPNFNQEAYLAANPDVAKAIMAGTMDSPMGHYTRHGQYENRLLAPIHEPAPSYDPPGFDEAAYLAVNQDVAEAVARGEMTAEEHFQRHGQDEGRVAFDTQTYLAHNQDVAEAVAAGHISAVDHWNTFGQYEGRDIHIAPVAEHAPAADAPAQPASTEDRLA
jgi:hypothetical protein